MKFTKSQPLKGEIHVPGDKSISHRSIMLGSIAQGVTEVRGFLQGADCLSTISCFRQMGVEIENDKGTVVVHGNGMRGLKRPGAPLDCGNSGTTTRIIAGLLSAQDFDVTLTGDASIRKRPMRRIIEPLTLMGAKITSVTQSGCAPLNIVGQRLHGINYRTKVASAQVKSSILLAGLYADSETRVTEPAPSRNHTEIMLRHFGADIRTKGTSVIIRPTKELYGKQILVPGDISSAAYFIAAGTIVAGSELLIHNVGINPTRDGMIRVCQQMGADITLENYNDTEGEPTADILVKAGSLKGVTVEGSLIPTLIDELPVIAVMACFAEGTTVIRDAAELKVKESNRIEAVVKSLAAMGADVEETPDGMIIHGGKPLHGAVIDSRMDHRIAMSFAVAALAAEGETEIRGSECVNISYPSFYEDLKKLQN